MFKAVDDEKAGFCLPQRATKPYFSWHGPPPWTLPSNLGLTVGGNIIMCW